MKPVAVTNSESAIVDDEDFDFISSFKWHVGGGGYPTRHMKREGSIPCREDMHRTIMGLTYGDKRHVDHINGNKFDNRRCNLRICEPSENWCNQKRRSDNTSGYKGVSWSKSSKKWVAKIKRRGVRFNLGCFDSAEEAHAAYCRAAIRIHGEFANTGIPIDKES